MNWYKMTKLAGLPAVNLRTFLKKIELMGAEFKREGKGDHAIYWDPQTRKQTPVPMGPGGRAINPLTLVRMLRNIGFNLQEFRGIGESQAPNDIYPLNIDMTDQPEEEVPEWQRSPWYQKQQETQRELQPA